MSCTKVCLMLLAAGGILIAILIQLALHPNTEHVTICDELTSSELSKHQHFFQLKDKRMLEYFRFGDENSETYLLVLHGVMTDGSVSLRNNKIFKQLNLNVISPSLPGWGLSDPTKHNSFDNSSILDDATDIIELMNGLNITKFMIGAWSAGAMYGLGIASILGDTDRIEKLGLFVPVSMYYGKCRPYKSDIETNIRYMLGLRYIRDVLGMITRYTVSLSFVEQQMIEQMSNKYENDENGRLKGTKIWNASKRSLCRSWIGLNTMSKYIVSDWNDINFKNVAKVEKILVTSNLNDTINVPTMQTCLQNLIRKQNGQSRLLQFSNKTHMDVMWQTKDLLNRLITL